MNTGDTSKVTSCAQPQHGPGIWRMEQGGRKKMPSKLDLRPKTNAGTQLKIQGRPRKPIKEGGVQLILAAKFRDWLKKSPRRAAEWKRVKDKRRYFLCLARVAALSINSEYARTPLVYCQSTAPELTRAALILLRKRRAKVRFVDYSAACSAPSYGTATEVCEISDRERAMRRRIRAAEIWFKRLSRGKVT